MNPHFIYAFKFIKYMLFSKHKKGHGIHSPFVFKLITNVFNNKSTTKNLKHLDSLYNKYKRSKEIIECKKIGAGSVYKSQKNITVGNTIRTSSVNIKYGHLLYNLVKYFKSENILELGTSVGISTAYINLAYPKSNFTSIEGMSEKIAVAEKISDELNMNNIKFVHGDFDTILDSVLEKYEKLDFVFFDGNHRKENTLKYFNSCITKAHNDSIFVFDDIHWSKEMEKAWEVISNDKKVKLSVDLFRMGLIFFRNELSYEQYVIKF